MTNAPNSGNQPEPTPSNQPNQRLWLLILTRSSIGLGIFLLIAIVGGGWWVWIFVHRQLAPLVEKNLSDLLSRPVQLGKVESFSLNGLRFGKSSIPNTATDPDKLSADAIDVAFDPLSLLLSRTLHLDVTVIKPNVYIEQDNRGRWVSTQIKALEGKGPITTKLESVRVQNANVVLVPSPKQVKQQVNKETKAQGDKGKISVTPAESLREQNSSTTQNSKPKTQNSSTTQTSKLPYKVAINEVDGVGRFLNQNQKVNFEFTGKPLTGGALKIVGSHVPKTQETTLAIETQNLLATDINSLITLPLDIEVGRVNSNLAVQLVGGKPESPSLLGTASFQDVNVKIPALPKKLTRTTGALEFKGYVIELKNITTFYGVVPVEAGGSVDTQLGYNISAKTAKVSLKNAINALGLNLPVAFLPEPKTKKPGEQGKKVVGSLPSEQKTNSNAQSTVVNAKPQPENQKSKAQNSTSKILLAGEVQASLKVTGTIQKPVVSGAVAATKRTQIDRLNFRAVSGGFQLVGSTLAITGLKAIPTVGGQIDGSGVIKLGEKGGTTIDFVGRQLPGDAIARIYGVTPPIVIGTLSGKGQVVGPWNNLQTVVRWNAPAATYPGTGELVIAPTTGKTLVRDTTIKIAGGTVKGGGQINNDGRWQASITVAGVQPKLISPQFPPALQAPIFGKFNLAGNLGTGKLTNVSATGSSNQKVGTGTVKTSNIQVGRDRWQASVEAVGVRLGSLANVPPILRSPVSARFNLSGSLKSFTPKTIEGSGQGTISVAGGIVRANSLQIKAGRWQTSLEAVGIELGRLTNTPSPLQGKFSGRFNLAGSLENFKPETIVGIGQGTANIGGGTVKANRLQLASGRWQASLAASGVQVGRLANVPPQLKQSKFSGNFNLAGSLTSFKTESISGVGQGNISLAGGTLQARRLQLGNGRWQAFVQTNNLEVARLAKVPPQLKGRLTAALNLSGSLTSFKPESVGGTGAGVLALTSGGRVAATNLRLGAGKWQAKVIASGVPLRQFSQELRGQLTGALDVAGSLLALDVANVRGGGQVNFSQGLSLIDRSLTASVNWDGQKLQIQQATAQGFAASGVVFAKLQGNTPQVTSFNLDVSASDLNLASLPFKLPNNLTLQGRADFVGAVSGTPTAPSIVGNIPQLRNLAVNGFKFEPVLSGNVQLASGKGSSLQLSGTEDKIQVALSANNRPESFLLQRQGAIAKGRTQGEELLVETQSFPIAILKNFAPNEVIASQPIGGQLSGNFAINLNTYSIVGNNIAIAKPQFGNVKGDLFTGDLSYVNGVAKLTNAEFRQGESKYLLSGSLSQTPNGPEFTAKVNVDQGKIEDVLATLQIFDLQDLSRGTKAPNYAKSTAILPISPVGLPNDTLQNQLRRLSEIQALIEQQRQQRREASPLPELRDLKGIFTGEITAQGSPQKGIQANFDLGGRNWTWGIENSGERFYKADRVVARGSFQNGVLTLLPLRISSEETVLAFSGNVGGEQQTGQLRIRNVPAEIVREFIDIPVDITGEVNATATLAGSLQNPQSIGEITLNEGTLNGAQVKTAQSSFKYANANLTFSSTVIVENPEPININGSIPLKLPFATVQPESNQIRVSLNVKDEGLALLNLLTRKQVAWVDGQGDVKLRVTGTIDPNTSRVQQLVADGVATVNNATIKAQALPEPLKEVRGKVLFNLDRLEVVGLNPNERFQGKYSGGLIQASGILPISNPIQTDNPLTIDIAELALKLKGLYNGGVKGNLAITGTALAPNIGGGVELSNGEVLLAETTAASQATSESESAVRAATGFNNLKLTLGRNVQVARPPILNFLATGDLTINGNLGNIRPAGTIQLRRGQVNLFTTQFRLAGGYPQTAQFVPNQGLDPNLNVRLVTSVPEIIRNRVTTTPISGEINDNLDTTASSLGSLQTIRIQASVTGKASQLADNLDLRSNPPRSKTELVALLGGGFVDTLGRGDSTLGLANLAGSALLGNVQNVIGNALGLTEFRLFPTIITNNNRRGESSSTLGLGAEAGIDITPKLSASVLKILTAQQPALFNLRYRINDEILLRGSTDLSGENRAVVEYESRF